MLRKSVCQGLVAILALALTTEVVAVDWNVSLWGKRRAFTEHVEKLAELVSARTNGEFTLNLSYGGLSKNRENLDGISIGAFEMAQFCAGYHHDKNPTITILELPFLGVGSLQQERMLSQAVYQHPAVVADMARWNATLLMPSPLPQYNVDEALDHYIAHYTSKTMDAWGPILDAKGIQRSYTEAELVTFRKKVAGPAAEAWIVDNSAKGIPAQELYDLMMATLAQ